MVRQSAKAICCKAVKGANGKELDKDIEWVCNSLGFVTSRDQDKTAFKILKALIKSAKQARA